MKNLIFAALALIAFASCDDEHTPHVALDADFVGTVTVAPTNLSLSDVNIELNFSENGSKVDIEMLQVKFADKMPKLDLKIAGVTATELSSGAWKLSGANIIPTSAGVPNPNYTISELTGTLSKDGKSLEFTMKTGTFTISFKGAPKN